MKALCFDGRRDRISDMNTVVLLGTAHTIQRGENAPTLFRAVLMKEWEKHKVKAIAEEIDNGLDTVASTLAADLSIEYLYADPDSNERFERGIQSDCRLDIVLEYSDRYSEIAIWPKEPSKENLPAEVWNEYDKRTNESYRMREQVWLEKIVSFDKWPLLFICGAIHFQEFSKLLVATGYRLIESQEDWAPINQ